MEHVFAKVRAALEKHNGWAIDDHHLLTLIDNPHRKIQIRYIAKFGDEVVPIYVGKSFQSLNSMYVDSAGIAHISDRGAPGCILSHYCFNNTQAAIDDYNLSDGHDVKRNVITDLTFVF